MLALGSVFDGDQLHRVSLRGDILAILREVPQLMKQSTNVNPALWRKARQALQPEVNGSGLYVGYQAIPPFWHDVVFQSRLRRSSRAEPCAHFFGLELFGQIPNNWNCRFIQEPDKRCRGLPRQL